MTKIAHSNRKHQKCSVCFRHIIVTFGWRSSLQDNVRYPITIIRHSLYVPMTPCCISSCWRRAADWYTATAAISRDKSESRSERERQMRTRLLAESCKKKLKKVSTWLVEFFFFFADRWISQLFFELEVS